MISGVGQRGGWRVAGAGDRQIIIARGTERRTDFWRPFARLCLKPASSSLFKGSATTRSMGNAGFVALYLTLVCLSRSSEGFSLYEKSLAYTLFEKK